ncbi:unnamed protein product [Protopolystoma xenopodis]|uniref:Uncharacterized protein n=1 Tax=Protopolystoma xenopodis TaxID=117903 RepID=A0A3S5CF98_9PLAT|nr:unnamed protein product [Protopolystoma xenopodis]
MPVQPASRAIVRDPVFLHAQQNCRLQASCSCIPRPPNPSRICLVRKPVFPAPAPGLGPASVCHLLPLQTASHCTTGRSNPRIEPSHTPTASKSLVAGRFSPAFVHACV